jgi:alkylation response protein AidB-like acyl-CoA dehydrogenase
MRAGAPVEAGALELRPGVSLRAAEEIARGDASAGWCVSIAITSSLLGGYLPEDTLAELIGSPEHIAAGIWAPRGRFRPADGGLVVSGRWAFCSGINHSNVLFAGCLPEAEPAADQPPPLPSTVALPKRDLEVLDTWHTLGLRGTGSHDVEVRDLFVPAERILSVFDGPVRDRPLYRFPIFGFFALSIGAAALGNARGALDEVSQLASHKLGAGASRALGARSANQAVVAEAEAAIRAARSGFYEAIDAAWAAAQVAEPVSTELRIGLRLAATHAVQAGARAVSALFELASRVAIYDDSPLQRRLRDAFTMLAHIQVNAASRELQGRVLLDQPVDTTIL